MNNKDLFEVIHHHVVDIGCAMFCLWLLLSLEWVYDMDGWILALDENFSGTNHAT